MWREMLTPIRARNENAVPIIAYGVDQIVNGIAGPCSEHNMLGLNSMDRAHIAVEEIG